MSFILKNKIFNLFGVYETLTDKYKNNLVSPGKGIKQRYYESVAEDFDEELIPFIEKYTENLLEPKSLLSKFIFYSESMWGGLVTISPDEEIKRKILRFANHILTIKSTIPSYELLFRLLGATNVIVTEDFTKFGFDSPLTFDDEERVFDSACPNCTKYDIEITGLAPLSPELRDGFYNIIKFLEPINARLGTFLYNGFEVIFGGGITIFINQLTGVLSYEQGDDETLTLSLNSNGHLIVDGNTEAQYTINSEGHLIFTP